MLQYLQMKKVTVNLISESVFTVQGHGVHTAFIEMENLLAKQPSINLLVNQRHARGVDITHFHTFGFFALRRLLSRHVGKKVISAHVVPDSLVGSIAGAKVWIRLFKHYLRWFYNQADLVIAVSPYTKEELIKLGIKSRITVLPNSIDTTQYHNSPDIKERCRRELGLDPKRAIVVGNGQVQPRKRFDSFIRVANQLPEVQFIWIGGIPFKAAGADFAELSRAMRRSPANVLVTDVVPHQQARLYMQASDLMFMPSEQETFGLALIEGAACGMPVIVRDIHDYDATFGDLVIRSDEDHFAATIKRYLTDKQLYADGVKRSHRIASRYDTTRTEHQLLDLYRSLLSDDSEAAGV